MQQRGEHHHARGRAERNGKVVVDAQAEELRERARDRRGGGEPERERCQRGGASENSFRGVMARTFSGYPAARSHSPLDSLNRLIKTAAEIILKTLKESKP